MDVKIEDLPDTSNAKVEVKCDFCEKLYIMAYCKYISTKDSGNCCYACRHKKAELSNLNKYGVKNTSELLEVKEKRKKTCMDRYGQESNLCLKETQEKIKSTNIEKYGVMYPSQNDDIKRKIKGTNLIKYGFDNPMKNNCIKEKVRKSLYQNGTCPSSKAQRYLCDLYNGILNYSVDWYNLDILIGDNIYIEYNGSGHDMNITRGSITEEEFRKKENIRYNYLKSKGYRMILYINKSDKLPNDRCLLDLLNNCKKYLIEQDNYKIIIDLDKIV